MLELGGSDPFIVLEDAPLDEAIETAFFGRMVCMGQACASPKRFIIIGEERGRKFIDDFVKKVAAMEPGDPADPKTTLGPLFAERAVLGLIQQIDAAKAAGARVVIGGKRLNRPGFYLEPTVITDITPENPLFLQEAFGPVASIYVVKNENEALKIANATKFGLGSSIYSGDIARAKKLAEKIDSGMVFINSMGYTGPEVPFGGTKNSGFGRELSELGIQEFVNHKLIRVPVTL